MDYTSINVKNLVDDAYIEHLKKGLEQTRKAFSSLIRVSKHFKITIGEVYLHQCDSNLILSQQLREGVIADLILLPIVVTESTLGVGVIASAGACLSAYDKDNRPVAGIVYLGANYDFSKENSDTFMAEILFHEITHVLVFSPILFNNFPDDSKPVTEVVEWNGPVAFHTQTQDEDYKFNGHCEYGKPYNNIPYGETLGKTSACFMTTLVKDGVQGISTPKPICHSVTCGKDSYNITIEGNIITCNKDIKSVKVPRFSGELQCVNINRMCQEQLFVMIYLVALKRSHYQQID